jgi:mono/diheme cytochrome c family protein
MKRAVTLLLPPLCVAAFALMATEGARVQVVAAQAPAQGFYTAAQRARGEMVYSASCSSCHGANLLGRSSFTNGVPPLTGDDFLDMWVDQTVAELFQHSRSTPPEDHTKVTPQQSADALAYVLSKSNFPAGQTEMGTDASALTAMKLEERLRTKGAAATSLPTRSTQEGVFSAAQSKRGAAVYATACAACHADSLGGKDVIPPLAGPAFLDHWIGSTADDLFKHIQMTMPQDNPGGLTDQEYTDIVAYMLDKNKFPAGSKELDADRAALATIRIDTKK